MLILLFFILSSGARLHTSFYTFQKLGDFSITDLYVNYLFLRYNFNLVLEKRQNEFGLKSFCIGIDSIIKNYHLTIGEKQYFLNGPLSTTIPLWGLTFSGQNMSLFAGKTKDQTTALPPTFHQNNYTFGFTIKPSLSYRVPIEFYFLKKSDVVGLVRNNNSLGTNAKIKISDNLQLKTQWATSLGEAGIGNAISIGSSYTNQKYGTTAFFRKIFKNFITPTNLQTEPENWFQLSSYAQPLWWVSLAQDLSYSDPYNLNLGLGFRVNRYPLPDFVYGISFSRRAEICGQNIHCGWRYKYFSIAYDYAWSTLSRSWGLRLTQNIEHLQIWSQLQSKEGKIYQVGSSISFSPNTRLKGFLNLVLQNGVVRTNKGIELSLKFLKNFNLNSTYELITHNQTKEHFVSLSLSNSLFFGKTGFSFITGKVFMDMNNNGIFDYEDRVVSDVEVILDGKNSVKTDKNGNYQFAFVPSGEHILNLHLGCMPAEIGTKKRGIKVNTKFLSRVRVHFPLEELGLIDGVVYYDDNKNGKQDHQEPGVPNVVIGLNGHLTTSDINGKFRYANLVPGTYALEVRLLPPETNLVNPYLTYINIKPGEKFRNYQIGVIRQEQPVQKKIFKETQLIQPQKPPVPKKPTPPKISVEEADVLYKKGVAYFIAHQYTEALKIFNQLLSFYPDHKGAKEYKKRTELRLEVLKKR